MSKIPLALRIQEFLEAREEWSRARRAYLEARIIFEATDQIRRLEEEGPDSISLPRLGNYEQRSSVFDQAASSRMAYSAPWEK